MGVTAPIPMDTIACIIRQQKGGAFVITCVFNNGRVSSQSFDNDGKKRDELWGKAELEFIKQGFVPHGNMCIRAEDLTLVELIHTPELGNCIHFRFRGGADYKQSYADEGELKRNYARLSDIMAILQDRRTNCPLSKNVH